MLEETRMNMGLKGIAKATVTIQDEGRYTNKDGHVVCFKDEQLAAIAGTQLYKPQMLKVLRRPQGGDGVVQIEVTDESTQAAARRLVEDEEQNDLALLNFASARNAGGGFLKGAKAQEEDLTRSSGLYRCLVSAKEYYSKNRAQSSMLYTHHIIYSPKVPWFRTDNRSLLPKVFLASVITAPAPNAGEHLRRCPPELLSRGEREVQKALDERCEYVLQVAADKGHKHLLLGAWGCGVFRNSPEKVANTFGKLLEGPYRSAFSKVTFAVYDKSRDQKTLAAFLARFGYQNAF